MATPQMNTFTRLSFHMFWITLSNHISITLCVLLQLCLIIWQMQITMLTILSFWTEKINVSRDKFNFSIRKIESNIAFQFETFCTKITFQLRHIATELPLKEANRSDLIGTLKTLRLNFICIKTNNINTLITCCIRTSIDIISNAYLSYYSIYKHKGKKYDINWQSFE